MRITIVTGPFQPTPPAPCGAVERRWTQAAGSFVKLGHTTTVISRKHEMHRDREEVEGVRHIRVRGATRTNRTIPDLFKDLIYSLRVWHVLPDADILVTNVFWLPALLSVFSKSRKGKIVVNVARFPKRQIRLYGRCARLLAVSSAIGDSIIEQCPDLAPLVHVIVNPVNTRIFTPPDTPRRQKAHRTILYTGRIHPEKGLHLLIDAFRELHQQFPNLRLKLLGQQMTSHGGGGEKFIQQLKQQSAELPVEFAPPLFDIRALAEELRNADYYCYPSMAYYGEACPVAPLEAMATGLAPIVSDLPQFNDYVEDGRNGLIFHRNAPNAPHLLADQLRKQIVDDALAARMGRAAYERAQTQGNLEVAQRYIDDFQTLLSDSPVSPVRDNG
ncbi:MAG: glycosyltransferase family 4 protein [Phycisphaerales bacterium]